MTIRPDPPIRVLRSLPLAILLATAVSVAVWPFVKWLGLLVAGMPIPPRAVWEDYLAIRAVAGVCVGAAAYAAVRLPGGWLRSCVYWTLFFVIIEGDVEDFARWSLGDWLSIWLVGSLVLGVLAGTLVYGLERRRRASQAA